MKIDIEDKQQQSNLWLKENKNDNMATNEEKIANLICSDIGRIILRSAMYGYCREVVIVEPNIKEK